MSIEWALVFFTLLACLAVGVFGAITVSEWRGRAASLRYPGALFALVALGLSGLSSVLHLGHPERIFGALGHPTSGIFMEALLLGLFGLAMIFYILALRRDASDATRKGIAATGMIPAILLAFAVGYTYVMPSRPAWDTLILPLVYLASAGVLGSFGYAALATGREEDVNIAAVTRAALLFLGIDAVLTAAYVAWLALAPYADASRSSARVLAGDLAPLFWIGVVLAGFIVPAWVAVSSRKTETLARARLGLVGALIGGIAFRALMFTVGSSVRDFF